MDHSLPGSSVHGILQARKLEWAAMASSRESSQPRGQTRVSCFLHWQAGSLPLVPPGKPQQLIIKTGKRHEHMVHVKRKMVPTQMKQYSTYNEINSNSNYTEVSFFTQKIDKNPNLIIIHCTDNPLEKWALSYIKDRRKKLYKHYMVQFDSPKSQMCILFLPSNAKSRNSSYK